jgi:hypothetical protein
MVCNRDRVPERPRRDFRRAALGRGELYSIGKFTSTRVAHIPLAYACGGSAFTPRMAMKVSSSIATTLQGWSSFSFGGICQNRSMG